MRPQHQSVGGWLCYAGNGTNPASSSDAATDAMIQSIFRTEFADSTCITIAHRINTIMDSNFILVMDDGKAAEFDSPNSLMRKGGLFRDLVRASSSPRK